MSFWMKRSEMKNLKNYIRFFSAEAEHCTIAQNDIQTNCKIHKFSYDEIVYQITIFHEKKSFILCS
jgi:hypothetical protein